MSAGVGRLCGRVRSSETRARSRRRSAPVSTNNSREEDAMVAVFFFGKPQRSSRYCCARGPRSAGDRTHTREGGSGLTGRTTFFKNSVLNPGGFGAWVQGVMRRGGPSASRSLLGPTRSSPLLGGKATASIHLPWGRGGSRRKSEGAFGLVWHQDASRRGLGVSHCPAPPPTPSCSRCAGRSSLPRPGPGSSQRVPVGSRPFVRVFWIIDADWLLIRVSTETLGPSGGALRTDSQGNRGHVGPGCFPLLHRGLRKQPQSASSSFYKI